MKLTFDVFAANLSSNVYKNYTTTDVVPLIDYGIQVMAFPIVRNINLKDLNADIGTTAGYAENYDC